MYGSLYFPMFMKVMKAWSHNGTRIRRYKTSETVDEICAEKIDIWVVAAFWKIAGPAEILFWQRCMIRSKWNSWHWLYSFVECCSTSRGAVPCLLCCLAQKQSLNRLFPLSAEMLLPSRSWIIIWPNLPGLWQSQNTKELSGDKQEDVYDSAATEVYIFGGPDTSDTLV